jgi:hypothetical protein
MRLPKHWMTGSNMLPARTHLPGGIGFARGNMA